MRKRYLLSAVALAGATFVAVQNNDQATDVATKVEQVSFEPTVIPQIAAMQPIANDPADAGRVLCDLPLTNNPTRDASAISACLNANRSVIGPAKPMAVASAAGQVLAFNR